MLQKTNEATVYVLQLLYKLKSLVERAGTIRPVSLNFYKIKRLTFVKRFHNKILTIL